jgi:hypothetical protein
VVLVGDRGMITQARIDGEIAPAGCAKSPKTDGECRSFILKSTIFCSLPTSKIGQPENQGGP